MNILGLGTVHSEAQELTVQLTENAKMQLPVHKYSGSVLEAKHSELDLNRSS